MASRHPPPVRRQSGSGTRYQQAEPSPSHSKVGPAGVDATAAERGPPQMNTGTELWLFTVSVAAGALGGMLGMASGIFIVPILTLVGPRRYPQRHRRQHRLRYSLFMQQCCSFSKGPFDQCTPRDPTGDRDDGGCS